VEHQYSELITKYKKTLVQRNRSLHGSLKEIYAWDKQLVLYGEQIDTFLKEYSESLAVSFTDLVNSTGLLKPTRLEFRRGWRDDETFSEALKRTFKNDRERGFTSCGPHRSDLKIMVDDQQAKNFYSRGEAKVTAILILLSQLILFDKKNLEKPILLIDDLRSELDKYRYEAILDLIRSMQIQTFITDLDEAPQSRAWSNDSFSMFHVEHGCVRS
jgi:DNA replication and repair protein RecF